MYVFLKDNAKRDEIIAAIKAAPSPVRGHTRNGRSAWIKPHAGSRIIVGYSASDNVTYFHDDVLRHEQRGNVLDLTN